MEKLILLKRQNPVEYEIHKGSISQTKNLVLTTTDKQFAQNLVDGYNQHIENIRIKTGEENLSIEQEAAKYRKENWSVEIGTYAAGFESGYITGAKSKAAKRYWSKQLL